MSLLRSEPIDQQRITSLVQNHYHVPNFTTCDEHKLPKDHTCLNSKSDNYFRPVCPDCDSKYPLVSFKRVVPAMASWATQQWSEVQKEHSQIEAQWKTCLINVNYCIDILKEVKKQIEDRSQSNNLPLFREIIAQIHGVFTHDSNNISPQATLKSIEKMVQKYKVAFVSERQVRCELVDQERENRKTQVSRASRQTKSFSEAALAFSEELARTIEERMKAEKRSAKLKEIVANRTINLRELMREEANAKEVGELLIEIPRGDKQGEKVGDLLNRCHNLHSLSINNRQGTILKHRWHSITQGMQMLKFLKELSLNLRASDLPILTSLFRQHSKAVRQVEKLNLSICDEKELKIEEVCDFINTLELRSLRLTLARDRLTKAKGIQLLTKLRLASSMSQLPLSELHINLNKNEIEKQDYDLFDCFGKVGVRVKVKELVL